MVSKPQGLLRIVVGIFFMMIGITAIAVAIKEGTPYLLFWACYSSLILIGIAMIREDSSLLVSQLSILSIPLIIWTVDFIVFLFTKHSLFGLVDYFFHSGNLARFISLQHLFTLPLSFYMLRKMPPPKRNIWLASWFQLLLIFVSARLLTPEILNISCVYHSCLALNLDLSKYYTWIWIGISFIMVAGTNQIISRMLKITNLLKKSD